jgi:hypothetical protein
MSLDRRASQAAFSSLLAHGHTWLMGYPTCQLSDDNAYSVVGCLPRVKCDRLPDIRGCTTAVPSANGFALTVDRVHGTDCCSREP